MPTDPSWHKNGCFIPPPLKWAKGGYFRNNPFRNSNSLNIFLYGIFSSTILTSVLSGSEEELRDLKKAYNQCKGDLDKMYEHVPFLSLKEEGRVCGIIRKMIDSKELPVYDIFVNEPQSKRDRRIRKVGISN